MNSPNIIEPISSDISYFIELFTLIENIQQPIFPKDLKNKIENFLNIIKTKNELIQKETIYFLTKSLSESVFIETSLVFRYLLKQAFNIDYSGVADHKIATCDLDDRKEDKEYNIFTNESESIDDISDILNNVGKENKLKPFGNFFSEYKNKYEYDNDLAIKICKKCINRDYYFSKAKSEILVFPEYLNILDDLYECVFFKREYNPYDIFYDLNQKYYIAILASCSIGCDYLTKELISKFLLNGGDKTWLENGIESSKKFKSIANLCNILANKPFDLNEKAISELDLHIKNFSKLCLFISVIQKFATIISILNIKFNTKKELEKIKEERILKKDEKKLEIDLKLFYEYILDKKSNSNYRREKEKQKKWLKKLKDDNPINYDIQKNSPYKKFISSEVPCYENFSHHFYEYIYQYEFDFHTVCYCIIEEYWPELLKIIREDCIFIERFTSNNFGIHEPIENTDSYRRCIITYVEILYGMIDQCHNYEQNNKLLTIYMKYFIKNIVCFPKNVEIPKIDKNDFDYMDLLHIILLSSQTKLRIQITYVTKSMKEFDFGNMLY